MIKKRNIFFIIITIVYLFALISCVNNKKELRLRILANSNSEYDQNIKIEVKNYLEKYFKDTSIQNVNEKILENSLKKQFNIKIKVERKIVDYEAKSYDGKIIPSGAYETLLVTIGEGIGRNFWTILYPEFFNISFEDDNEIQYKSYFYELFN